MNPVGGERGSKTATGRSRLLTHWLPVVAWAALISIFSTGYFSGDGTSRFIEPLLRSLFPAATAETIRALHQIIRKFAHLSEYAVLAILLWRALDPMGHLERSKAFSAFAACALYSVVDEWHQVFVPSRVGSLWDSFVDSCGAALGILVRHATLRVWKWVASRGDYGSKSD